jgi:hypothetical protein
MQLPLCAPEAFVVAAGLEDRIGVDLTLRWSPHLTRPVFEIDGRLTHDHRPGAVLAAET